MCMHERVCEFYVCAWACMSIAYMCVRGCVRAFALPHILSRQWFDFLCLSSFLNFIVPNSPPKWLQSQLHTSNVTGTMCVCSRSVSRAVSGKRRVLERSHTGNRHPGHHPPAQDTSVSRGRRDSCHGGHGNQHRPQKGRLDKLCLKNCNPSRFSSSALY